MGPWWMGVVEVEVVGKDVDEWDGWNVGGCGVAEVGGIGWGERVGGERRRTCC